MKFSYKSIAFETESLLKEKGSRFIGLALPVYNEFEIKVALSLFHKNHPNATHICYAYRIGVNQQFYRAFDDGELSNTAGIPILGQIQSFDLTNVLIAVIRYYGGTKLGAGGLIQAYRNAAKIAIELSEIIEKELVTDVEINFPYEQMPSIMSILKNHKTDILSQDFNEVCKIVFRTENSKVEIIKRFFEKINELTIEREIIGK